MTTATIELAPALQAGRVELSCILDRRVATHELLGAGPCHHFYCLEHSDYLTRFVESVLLRHGDPGEALVECATHRRFFRSDCASWRIVPIQRGAS